MPENPTPYIIPCRSPDRVLVMNPPATPPTATTAAMLQSVQTPIEHSTATNSVRTSSDRMLNWYQGSSGLLMIYRFERNRAVLPPNTPPASAPIIATIFNAAISSQNGFQTMGIRKMSHQTNAKATTPMTAPMLPNTPPSTRPDHVLAAIPPATPPTAMTTETLQSVQTPIEHSTATKTVNSSSDRRLN